MASAPIGALPSGEALAVSVLAVIAGLVVAGLIVVLLVRLVRRLLWRCLSVVVGMVTGVGVHAGAYQAISTWLGNRDRNAVYTGIRYSPDMSTEGYGVTVTINSHASCDFVADTYDAAAATLLNALRVSPQDAAATSEIVDIVDDRIVVHDEGTVAELLAWATGTPRR